MTSSVVRKKTINVRNTKIGTYVVFYLHNYTKKVILQNSGPVGRSKRASGVLDGFGFWKNFFYENSIKCNKVDFLQVMFVKKWLKIFFFLLKRRPSRPRKLYFL